MKQYFLTLILCVCVLSPINASGFSVEGLSFNILDDEKQTVEVTSCYGGYTGDIVVPAFAIYNGKKYTVTSIGNNAFKGCYYLRSVAISEGVTSIGDSAFYYCPDMVTLTIPNSVKHIGH